MITDVYIALGSNVRPRVRYMLAALHRLSRLPDSRIARVSSVYESAAHTRDGEPQADYLNAVVRMTTNLDPAQVLEHCLQIEESLGRAAKSKGTWEPRTIDLDVLLVPGGPVSTALLDIPHPRMTARLFVLRPLAELIPGDERLEALGATVHELIDRCPDRGPLTRTVVDLRRYK